MGSVPRDLKMIGASVPKKAAMMVELKLQNAITRPNLEDSAQPPATAKKSKELKDAMMTPQDISRATCAFHSATLTVPTSIPLAVRDPACSPTFPETAEMTGRKL